MWNNMGAILAGLAALGSVLLTGWRNGKKADAAVQNSELAAKNTGETLAKATEVHEATQAIGKQATEIKLQTDGQLSEILAENKRLNDMLVAMMSIMSAREGTSLPVRAEDMGLPAAVEKVTTNGERAHDRPDMTVERRVGNRRK